MKRMLINAIQAEELRVALVNNQLLYDYITERPGFEEKIGNIYLGEISSIEQSLDAVFVNYGSKRHGFLPLKEISREYFIQDPSHPEKLERPNIKEVLKEGQKILVQVEKEERGNKGAALTSFISLAGSYLVLMPNNPRAGGISRRVEGEDREELREILSRLTIPDGMGLIVRTAGVGRSTEELEWDLNVLLNHWEAIKKASHDRSPPLLIHQESDVVIRAIRDYLRQDIGEIIIDSLKTFEKVKYYIQQVRPDFISRLKYYGDSLPLFIRYEIENQIESAYQRTVRLKSGGSLVIDHTEALVSIDINSARATKGADIEETAFNTNLEAAEEIARQLRLRDIGGLIVIDFIDMTRHHREVENHLRNAFKLDRARVQIGRISRFGLLEMSRQRLRPSLQEGIQEICPRCNGQGSIRNVESLSLSIIRIIEEDAIKENTAQIQAQLSTEAATYLLNEKRSFLSEIEKKYRINILIIPNPNLQYPNYQIKRIRKTDITEHGVKSHASYKLIETQEIEAPTKKTSPEKVTEQPVVKDFLPSLPPAPTAKKTEGLIQRLWSSMFGQATPKEKEVTRESQKKYGFDSQKQRPHKARHKRPRPAHKPAKATKRNQPMTRPTAASHKHEHGKVEERMVSSKSPMSDYEEYEKNYSEEYIAPKPHKKHRQPSQFSTETSKPEKEVKPKPATEKIIEDQPVSKEQETVAIQDLTPVIVRPGVKSEPEESKPLSEEKLTKKDHEPS